MIRDYQFTGKAIFIKSILANLFQIFRKCQNSRKAAAPECIIRNCFQGCTQFQSSIKTCTIIKYVFPNLSYTVRDYQISAETLTSIKCVFSNLCQIVSKSQAAFTIHKGTAVLEAVFSYFFQTLRKKHRFQWCAPWKCVIINFCNSFRQGYFFQFFIILERTCPDFGYILRYIYYFFISRISNQNTILYEIILSSFFYESCSITQARAISFCVNFITTGRYMDLLQFFHSINSEEIILSTAVQFDLRWCFSFKSQFLCSLTRCKCFCRNICYRTRDFYFF